MPDQGSTPGTTPGTTPGVTPGTTIVERLNPALERAYRISVRMSFAQLSIAIVSIAVVAAIALAVPAWDWLFDIPARPVAIVAAAITILTASPLTLFVVYVIKKSENALSQLEESNSILATERHYQMKLLSELKSARDEALSANVAKTQFLANMSHELRTPLNAVIGFSDMIHRQLHGPVGHEAYVDYAGTVCESAAHLLDLINDILDVARIEAGEYRLNEDLVDLEDAISRSIRIVRPRADQADVNLSQTVPPGLPQLRCDPKCLRQMLLNLLSNAIRFTPPDGRVTAGAALAADGDLLVYVSDTGIGMTAEEIPVALSRFSQIDNSHTRQHQGAGLGLSLTRDLVVLHGGGIDIESRPNEGTTVYLRFPAERLECHDAGNDIWVAENRSMPAGAG